MNSGHVGVDFGSFDLLATDMEKLYSFFLRQESAVSSENRRFISELERKRKRTRLGSLDNSLKESMNQIEKSTSEIDSCIEVADENFGKICTRVSSLCTLLENHTQQLNRLDIERQVINDARNEEDERRSYEAKFEIHMKQIFSEHENRVKILQEKSQEESASNVITQ